MFLHMMGLFNAVQYFICEEWLILGCILCSFLNIFLNVLCSSQ